jgi:hypothetical protein
MFNADRFAAGISDGDTLIIGSGMTGLVAPQAASSRPNMAAAIFPR